MFTAEFYSETEEETMALYAFLMAMMGFSFALMMLGWVVKINSSSSDGIGLFRMSTVVSGMTSACYIIAILFATDDSIWNSFGVGLLAASSCVVLGVSTLGQS